MKLNLLLTRVAVLLLIGAPFLLFRPASREENSARFSSLKKFLALEKNASEEEEEEDENGEFTSERLEHEYKMLRNPVTGTIPANIREIEMRVADQIPSKQSLAPWLRGSVQNNYVSVGPNNVGGRSRTLAFDRRNPNIMLCGGVTGGIFRSVDGGANWTFVSGEDNIRSATSLAQDPTQPDVWYCGTGEVFYPNSMSDIAGTFGHGMYKSTNNGLTWAKIPTTEDAFPNEFNGFFDLVHRVAVHPTTGDVYAAVHNRIMKQVKGQQTWTTVLGGTVGNTSIDGITEVIIPSDGKKIFAAFSGKNADRGLAGVWESATGEPNAWKRIAGGTSGSADSVAGWQPYPQWSRVVLALNGANTQLFVLYKNGKSADGATPQPEADLFRANISSNNPATYTWTNLNSYVPDEPNYNEAGIDPYTTQFSGYNMSIAVKPDNDNILFIGGTVLERVNLSQTNPALKFRRIGGYGKGFFPQPENFIYPNHHPDVHGVYFPPSNNDVLYTVDDGGVHKTITSTLQDTVRWTALNTGFQTLQYQFINIQQDLESNFIIGGTQDNGTQLNLNSQSSQEHEQIQGGDGASAAVSQFFKNGNTWKQYLYYSIVQGAIFRGNITWQLSGNTLSPTNFTVDDITPTGLRDKGQWLTLFINDPDSTEHIYYNNKNKLYRTRTASTVSATSWTEMTGVSSTVPASEEFTSMAVSKSLNGTKYLYFGTDGGKVYRLNNPNRGSASITPVAITPPSMTAKSYVAGISINPRSPDTVLVVVSNYDMASSNPPVIVNNIFWTGNATSANPTWQVIDGALGPVSSQSCAIVVRNSGVEYYVGTSVGLYSTTTISGNNTQWFNEGSGMLKKAIVRSLVNRQKDNKLVVGTHGNGAFVANIGDAVALPDNIIPGPTNPGGTGDQVFIELVYPTLTQDEVRFRVGNLTSVKQITVTLFGINGQKILQSQQPYQDGSLRLGRLARGAYVLQITSDDGQHRHVQRITRN